MEHETVNLNDLKVGDTIALKETITVNRRFLCFNYVILTISKITPKKTKMCFKNNYREINPQNTILYKVTPELKKDAEMANKKTVIARNINNRIRNIYQLPDGAYDNIANFINSLCEEDINLIYKIFKRPEDVMEKYKNYCIEMMKNNDE